MELQISDNYSAIYSTNSNAVVVVIVAIILVARTILGYFLSSNTQSATVWFPFITIFLMLSGWLLLIVLVSVSTVVPEVAAIKMLLFYPTGFVNVSNSEMILQ